MSKKPSNNKTPKQDTKFPFDLSLIVIGLLLVCAVLAIAYTREAIFVLVATILGCFFAIIVLCIMTESVASLEKKKLNHRQRRQLERRRIAANLEAQYKKRDFEVRLRSFTEAQSENKSEDVPESQMEFWERSEDYSLTPSRPIELIRMLLQRISKLVGQRR